MNVRTVPNDRDAAVISSPADAGSSLTRSGQKRRAALQTLTVGGLAAMTMLLTRPEDVAAAKTAAPPPIDLDEEAWLLCTVVMLSYFERGPIDDAAASALVAHIARVRADFVVAHGSGSEPAFERGFRAAFADLYATAVDDAPSPTVDRAEELMHELEGIVIGLDQYARIDVLVELDRLGDLCKAADPRALAAEMPRNTGTNRSSVVMPWDDED